MRPRPLLLGCWLLAAAAIAAHPRPLAPPAALPTILTDSPALDQIAYLRSRHYRLLQRQVRFDYFNNGSPHERLVALTFDDGPDPVWTPRILDLLREAHVPATFFVVGAKAERHPELLRRAAAEGHDLGNHTYHHLSLRDLPPEAVRFEIERTNQAIGRAVGGPTRWFRAPGCHYTAAALEVLQRLRMIRVDTTDNSGDWAGFGVGSILRRTLSHLSPGDIILCHDRLPETAEALPRLIAAVRARGYRFVPLVELALRAQAVPGFRPLFWPPNEGVTIEGGYPDGALRRSGLRPSRSSTTNNPSLRISSPSK